MYLMRTDHEQFRSSKGGLMRCRLITMLLAASVLVAAETNARGDKGKPERIGLWNRRAPIGGGRFQDAEAFITLHRPENPNGSAVVICPGGGYGGLVTGP